MEIQVKRLREALALLEPAVPKKATIPILTYVRLGDGKAHATDLEVAVSIDLPEVEDSVLLPLKALDFLRFAPGNEVARITQSDKRVTITVGDMATTLESADPQDFPPLPEAGGESEGVLDGDSLVRVLVSVAPYAAKEDTRPVLTGVYLNTADGLEAIAADGFRLRWEKLPGKLFGPSMFIPSKAVKLLEHLWKKGAVPDLGGATDPASLAMAKRLIRLNWGSDRVRMCFGVVTMVVELLQGTFPNYRQLIPQATTASVTVMAENMERVLKQVKPVARGAKGIVRFEWADNSLLVSVKAEESTIAVPVPATCTEPGRTALNLNYLQEYFKGRTGLVAISLTGSDAGPVLFAHRGVPHCLVMPMFGQWDTPAKTQGSEAEKAEPEAEATTEPEAANPKPQTKRRRQK